jgi:monoamine oxidase
MSSTLTRRQLVGAGAAGAALLATGAVPARAARRRTRRADVCIVGAGLSGLAAARALVAAGDSKHAGGFLRLINTAGGAQEQRFVGGSQLIAERVADRLGKRVVLRAPVRTIAQADGGVNVLADTVSVHARQVIVAVPPALAARIAFAPKLPKGKAALLKGFEGGTMAKVEAVYPSPFWRAAELSGQGVADVGAANTIFDNSPPDGSLGILLGFVGGSSYQRWASLPTDQRRAQVLASFVGFVGDQAGAPTEYLERNWAKEQWSRGCPVAHTPPGLLTKYGSWLRRPVGRVHFAGSETSDYWIGYMDGAVRAGQRAAREVIAAQRR